MSIVKMLSQSLYYRLHLLLTSYVFIFKLFLLLITLVPVLHNEVRNVGIKTQISPAPYNPLPIPSSLNMI
jgi:hypothetical protein